MLYNGDKLRSIYALDGRKQTIYYGGLSELLGLGPGLGFLILPASLADAFSDMGQRIKRAPPAQICEAVAGMLDAQEFVVHLREVRANYAQILRHLRECIQALLPRLAISEPQGGLHLVIYLPNTYDEMNVCAAAVEAGLPVAPLSHYCKGTHQRLGVILGFGMLSERMITPTIRQLADIFERNSPPPVAA